MPASAITSLPIRSGLDADWYTSSEHFALEMKSVIRPSWQYAGMSRDLRRPGDFITTTVHDMPVVVVRDKRGRLRAFVNACRHRGHPVAEGTGTRAMFTCPYHAWSYRLDGSLRSIPRCSLSDEQRETLTLEGAAVEEFRDWVFVSLDPNQSLSDWLGGLPGFVNNHGLTMDGLRFEQRLVIDIGANWKVAFENNVECYHCPSLHPETFSKLVETLPRRFRIVNDGNCIAELTDVAASRRRTDLARSADVDAQFYLMFPTTSISRDDYVGTAFTLHPLGPSRTRLVVDFFVDPSADEDASRDWIDTYDRTFQEDRYAMEAVQQGLTTGRLPSTLVLSQEEPGVAHFHDLLRRALHGHVMNEGQDEAKITEETIYDGDHDRALHADLS